MREKCDFFNVFTVQILGQVTLSSCFHDSSDVAEALSTLCKANSALILGKPLPIAAGSWRVTTIGEKCLVIENSLL